MAGRRAIANLFPDPRHEIKIQRQAGAKADEEHDAHVIIPVLTDGDGLDHFGHLLNLGIDFRRADPDAAGIKRRVRTAVDHHAIVFRDLGEIAMTPDVGKAGKVSMVIFRAIGIVPEHHRHRWKGLHADQLALSATQGVTLLVIDIDRHSQHRPLDFAAINGRQGIAADKAAADIGAARDRGQLHVALDVLINKVEAFGA